ncbi:MAG TPA: TonB-dependent receptor plug domain-containing protein, partial [Nannocystaceae bacterium]|nr:TonB-dependent receptor plug domain-containing protein [Nannocystaceae bacterium]
MALPELQVDLGLVGPEAVEVAGEGSEGASLEASAVEAASAEAVSASAAAREDDEVLPPAEDLDEAIAPVDEEEPDLGVRDPNRRVIIVTTDLLGAGTRFDLFRHAGGRSLVKIEDTKDRGVASVGEALDRMPGVRSVEGNAGIGSTSTKLNVGVRGANPRLSSEATVMLDEVPIAPAPYGQPQLSLFPISIFSLDRIDAVTGGASVRARHGLASVQPLHAGVFTAVQRFR